MWTAWCKKYEILFTKPLDLFISCLPGLERILHHEISNIHSACINLEIKPIQLHHPRSTHTHTAPKNHHDTLTAKSDRSSYEGGGGVSCRVSSLSQIMACHLFLGSASHVLIRCGNSFQATNLNMLTHKVSRMAFWKFYLLKNHNHSNKNNNKMMKKKKILLDIRVSTTKSRLYHTQLIAQSVEKGIHTSLELADSSSFLQDHTESSSSSRTRTMNSHDNDDDYDDHPPVRILVRIRKDQVQISIDSSSTPLHRRGYRLETGKAPLREDIAYALVYPHLKKSEQEQEKQQQQQGPHDLHYTLLNRDNNFVLDPFCGSGTIIIEAASMSMNLPSGRLRSTPLLGSNLLPYPHHHNDAWNDFVTLAVHRHLQPPTTAADTATSYTHTNTIVAMGSDRDRGVIDIAWKNAIRAGVHGSVQFKHCAISDNPWLQQSYKKNHSNSSDHSTTNNNKILVVTNPPFGLRISKSSSITSLSRKKNSMHPLLPLYQTLGKLVNTMNYDACILARDLTLARKMGIRNLKVLFTTIHGGISVCSLSSALKHLFSC